MNHVISRMSRAPSLALPLVLALAACGGGGSDSATPPGGGGGPAATSLKLTGTAAVGAAMASASIKVACAAGTATATADANGVYTVTITDGALPCVVTATSSDGLLELHSVAPGTGHADTVANVTPLSELLVAKLSGGDPKAFVTGFTSTTTINPADLSSAQAALLQTLSAAGINVTGLGDIVSGAITAGSGAGYDGVLDQLQALLTGAGTTLGELTVAVSTTASAGGDTSASTVATVLAPAASDCPGMKSGKWRVVDFANAENFVVQFDAAALTASADGATFPMTKNAACDYTIADGSNTRMLVTRSGLAVLVTPGVDGGAGVAMPEQKLDVAALAGTYDRVQYGAEFDTEAGDFGTTVFAADGQNGLSVNCPLGYGNCVEDTQSKGALVANANGGFDYMENGASQARVFAFRTPAGRTLLLGQGSDGTVIVLAAKDRLEMPTVGRVASYWQFTVNGAGLGAVSEDSNTVTTVDAAAGTYVRQFASDGHVDTIALNAPFDGTRYRAVNACASSTGGAYACNATVQLPFGGLVLSVSAVPTKHFITVSLDKP